MKKLHCKTIELVN